MHDQFPYAYPRNEQLFLMGDGPELLAFSAANDQGLWRQFVDDVLVGVGGTSEQVYGLDAGGRLLSFRPIDGQSLGAVDTGVEPYRMVVSPDGACAILHPGGLLLVLPSGQHHAHVMHEPSAVAFSADLRRVAVGTSKGTLQIIELEPAAVPPEQDSPPATQLQLGHSIAGIDALPDGGWVVGAGPALVVIRGKDLKITRQVPFQEPVVDVAASADGALVAVALGGQQIQVIEMVGSANVGTIRFDRAISHLMFGKGHRLGISFDDGDANRLDLSTGALSRTQAHPGRGQNAWSVQPDINLPLIRGAVARQAASGRVIAEKGKLKADKPVRKKKRNLTWLYFTIGAVVLLGLISLICGSSGLILLFGVDGLF